MKTNDIFLFTLLSTLATVICIAPRPCAAQEIKVLEQGGKKVDPNGKTIVTFTGETDEPVQWILEEAQWDGYGSGTFEDIYIAGRSQKSKALCIAPCKLELPNGTYKLRVGPPPNLIDLAEYFTVTASGGEQVWEVEEPTGWLYGIGVFGFSFGLSATLVGGGLVLPLGYGLDDPFVKDMGLVIVGVGVPLLVVGILALLEGGGDAELLRQTP